MKTTLTVITIITSLFFSACANNNRAEDWNARRAANASFQAERLTRLQMDLILNPFTLKFVPANPDVFQGVSSARFKKDIKPMDKTSETVLALKPVTFQYKSDTKDTPQFGLIAEEVAAVNPDLVVRDEKGAIYSVRYDAVNAMLLNEFLKEHHKVQTQQKEIDALRAELKEQRALIEKVNDKVELSRPAPQTVLNNH
jgi:Chaperone of endosialidase